MGIRTPKVAAMLWAKVITDLPLPLYYMGLAAPAASVLSILICGVLLAKQQRRGNGRGKPRP